MEHVYLYSQNGPLVAIITDDPEKIHRLSDPKLSFGAHHTVELHGKPYQLYISGTGDDERMQADKEMAIDVARELMTKGVEPIFDFAKVLLYQVKEDL